MRWAAVLERGLLEDGTIDRDELAAIGLEDLSLEELRSIVRAALQLEDQGLAVLLYRTLAELKLLREQLADVAAARRGR